MLFFIYFFIFVNKPQNLLVCWAWNISTINLYFLVIKYKTKAKKYIYHSTGTILKSNIKMVETEV
jgi:hypothetical protein